MAAIRKVGVNNVHAGEPGNSIGRNSLARAVLPLFCGQRGMVQSMTTWQVDIDALEESAEEGLLFHDGLAAEETLQAHHMPPDLVS